MTSTNEKTSQLEKSEPGKSRTRRALSRAARAFKRNPESGADKSQGERPIEGPKELIEEMQRLIDSGYETAVRGNGDWIHNEHGGSKVVEEYALNNPEGSVVRFSRYKFYIGDGANVRSYFHESRILTEAEYQEHVEGWGLRLSEKYPSNLLVRDDEETIDQEIPEVDE